MPPFNVNFNDDKKVGNRGLPVGDMINEMLFEHEAPSFDNIQKSLLEWFCINSKPAIKNFHAINLLNLRIDFLIRVDLQRTSQTNPLHFVFHILRVFHQPNNFKSILLL